MEAQVDIPRYVVVVVVSQGFKEVVMLRKATGPKFLRGKMTYPGGHIELNEHPLDAASRELFEETGLVVPREDFLHVATKEEPGKFELFVFAAFSATIDRAHTKTEEMVSVVSVDGFLSEFSADPSAFAPDAREMLLLSKVFLNHKG